VDVAVASVATGAAAVDWSVTHVPVAPSTDTVTTVVKPGAAAAAPTADPALASSTATIKAMTAARPYVRRHDVLTAVPLKLISAGQGCSLAERCQRLRRHFTGGDHFGKTVFPWGLVTVRRPI
jgi:hypothetical protein